MNFPQSRELSEVVRLYMRALILKYGILPYDYVYDSKEKPATPTSTEALEFGVSDGDAINKAVVAAKRKARSDKRKAEKKALAPPKKDAPSVVIRPTAPAYSASELAKLAEQAKQALAKASELAGERVIYCCAAVRIASKHKCKAGCQSKKHYKILREVAE